jgi:hypothetical protein
VKFFFKIIIPIFIFIVYVLAWVAEFQYQQSRVDARWNAGILWAGRLLWIVPMLLVPVGMWKEYPCVDVHDLIEAQYGIRIDFKQEQKFRVVNQKIVDQNYGNPPKDASDEKPNQA